ncbi:vasoactive intestinal polypeptide receptor 1-like [Agrilus planipennis]|uniref:Vasoactive intestinal polypeptide receptor 1-like n=1 Tax=Agrilus planipennis TaxID=224129 RepID=A0A7F5R9T1_AGRPL|nr:vasoactive intestinal polypeptide receptor 1-like [Agrilus planipennis]
METFYTTRLHPFVSLNASSVESLFNEESILSLLVVIGSSLSLVGLVFAFITYSLFSDLRNLSGTALMNLLAALFMTQLLYVFGVGGITDNELCIALAFSLQYSRLCVQFWLLVMTNHMFNHFRTNLNLVTAVENKPNNRFMWYSIIGWGVPAMFLGIGIYLHYEFVDENLIELKHQNCWHKSLTKYKTCLKLRICLVIRKSIVVEKNVCECTEKGQSEPDRITQIALVLVFTNIVSVLAKFFHSEWLWLLYNFVQSLQGIIISVLVTCNCRIIKIYSRSFSKRPAKCIATSRTNIASEAQKLLKMSSSISKSSSLQLLTLEASPYAV